MSKVKPVFKKTQSKMNQILSNKMVVVGITVILQLFLLMLFVWGLSEFAFSIYIILIIMSVIIMVYIFNKKTNPSFSMAWIAVIGILPLFGGVFYLLFGNKKVPKALSRSSELFDEASSARLTQDPTILENIKKQDVHIYKQMHYLTSLSKYPVFQNSKVTYFPLGEEKFASMIESLKQAESYIFLEYFIIEEGVMWGQILDILVEKAQAGLDVRVMYDDAGCATKLPPGYDQELIKKGIRCQIFNPLKARLMVQMNNRDHRKICIVDGVKAYYGGINLADEYINAKVRFGHWKDSAVLVEGEAVKSAVLMFLQFWDFNTKQHEDIRRFYRESKEVSDGYVQLFSDSPTDSEEIGETVHMNMINLAKEYVYIFTPYLVLGYEMIKSLTIAAKNGIDVRIVVPHHPDKWYVHLVTQSHYKHLIENGVKIYEYTPGFIHAKSFVADDEIAYVGSTNMDFRSYYLHFESGVVMYQSKAVMDIKEDALKTMAQSQQITLEDCQQLGLIKRMVMALLGLFSYLM